MATIRIVQFGRSKSLISLLVYLCMVCLPSAQISPQSNGVRVEITTTKKQFSVNEPVRFRALLINRGSNVIYVSKSFNEAGGGIAGFYVHVKQLTGKTPQIGCGSAYDRAPEIGTRSPEQILKEDFVRLPPGGVIGYEGIYKGCNVENKGQYEISAEYSAQDLNLEKVQSTKADGASVLAGSYKSNPVTFTVR